MNSTDGTEKMTGWGKWTEEEEALEGLNDNVEIYPHDESRKVSILFQSTRTVAR